MKRKIYLIQPTYRDREGRLLKGRSLFVHSLALPALSAVIPAEWEKEFCLEYFDEVDFDTDASVVGISCMVCDIFHASEMAREFRRRGKTVLIGGCAAQLWKAVVRPVADALVFGNPGPGDMARILADAEANRLAPEYACGMDVDFPFDYSVLRDRPISFMPVLASVGCRNRCEFCSTAAMGRGQHCLRSLDHVMADLRAVRRTTRRVAFVDNNFYNSRAHLMDLCRRIIDERLDILWGAECTLNVGEDPESLRLLRRAGCRMLIIGVESVNSDNLRDARKPNLADRYREQFRNIRDAGIYVGGFFIFGFDGDDPATVGELFAAIRDLRISLPMVNVLTPVPGTDLFERLERQGRMLMTDRVEFLRQNLHYDTPMYRCYFMPARMSPAKAERSCLDLRQRLSTLPQILRRSLVPSPLMTAVLLQMNLGFRAETRAIAKLLREEKRA